MAQPTRYSRFGGGKLKICPLTIRKCSSYGQDPEIFTSTRRGESENRNKELKCGLRADRLSDHRFKANFFRLYLHAFALNLLVRLRSEVSLDPPPEALGLENEPPVEAMHAKARWKYFNRRRRAGVLGKGQPATWRTRLMKVAVTVSVTTRRVLVKISGSWPYLEHFRIVSGQDFKCSATELSVAG